MQPARRLQPHEPLSTRILHAGGSRSSSGRGNAVLRGAGRWDRARAAPAGGTATGSSFSLRAELRPQRQRQRSCA